MIFEKKIMTVVISLVLTSCQILTSPPAFAENNDFSKCPQDWKLNLIAEIPSSSSDSVTKPKELQVIELSLKEKIAIRQLRIEFLDEKEKWIAVEPAYLYRISLAVSEHPFRVLYSIQKQGCPQPLEVYANNVYPKTILGQKRLTPEEFVELNSKEFNFDFLKKSEIANNIRKCVSEMKASAATSKLGDISESFGWSNNSCDTPATFFEVQPIFKQISCMNVGKDSNFYLKAGQECDLALVINGVIVLDFQISGPKKLVPEKSQEQLAKTPKLVTSEELQLAASAKKQTITCTKGKLIKRIIGSKPTCPAGYKKK